MISSTSSVGGASLNDQPGIGTSCGQDETTHTSQRADQMQAAGSIRMAACLCACRGATAGIRLPPAHGKDVNRSDAWLFR
jgi:hypothetical protein